MSKQDGNRVRQHGCHQTYENQAYAGLLQAGKRDKSVEEHYQNALDACEAAIHVEPGFLPGYVQLARMRQLVGKTDDAIQICMRGLVQVERMKKAVERWGSSFLRRVFTENEISYAYEKKEPYLPLSVRFAAKEALIKAIGSEIQLSFTDMEILNDPKGRPFIRAFGRLAEFFEEKSIGRAHLSLSHEREYGVACVVLEGE